MILEKDYFWIISRYFNILWSFFIMKKILLLFMCRYTFWVSAFHGTLCLTFDDRFFANWEKAIPLFARYNAHVTFFVNGKIDSEALAAMKKLQAADNLPKMKKKFFENFVVWRKYVRLLLIQFIHDFIEFTENFFE